MELIYALASVVVVSLVSLAGVFTLSLREEALKKYIFIFISLAVGALLGDSFIHLIPEAFESALGVETASVLVIGGIFLFFILEKFLHWHHHGEEEAPEIHPVGQLTLISDAFHNFVDGIIVGTSFIISIPVGIATTLAVVLHEIPQEVGDFAVLLHAGYTKTRALWLNFLSALCAVFGVFVAFLLEGASESLSLWILPLAAGGFIYVAVADLIPELHKTKRASYSVVQVLAFMAGVFAMIALLFLE